MSASNRNHMPQGSIRALTNHSHPGVRSVARELLNSENRRVGGDLPMRLVGPWLGKINRDASSRLEEDRRSLELQMRYQGIGDAA